MRYTVLGFNQKLCVDLNLTMEQLLLLDYIQKAVANPKMKHSKNNNLCVWLNHKKIIEDLPILKITDRTLSKWLKELTDKKLLCREIVHSSTGSRVYYGITDKTIELQTTPPVLNDLSSIDPPVLTDRSAPVSNDPPYKGQLNNKKLENISIKNTNNKKSLVKKKSLYEKMQDEILLFTKNTEIQDALTTFLNLQLEIYKEQGKTYYSNIFKSKLNKLKTDFDKKDWLSVIQNATDHGWQNFYPVKEYDKPRKKKRACDEGVTCEKYTEEEMREIEKWQQEQIAKGEQMIF